MSDEIKEITKVDKELLNKIEHILASELNCEEYDMFYNYFNEIRKPNILIDIKDDENIKELITNLQKENERLNNIIKEFKMYLIKKIEYMKYHSIERMVAYDDSLAKFKDLEGKK